MGAHYVKFSQRFDFGALPVANPANLLIRSVPISKISNISNPSPPENEFTRYMAYVAVWKPQHPRDLPDSPPLGLLPPERGEAWAAFWNAAMHPARRRLLEGRDD